MKKQDKNSIEKNLSTYLPFSGFLKRNHGPNPSFLFSAMVPEMEGCGRYVFCSGLNLLYVKEGGGGGKGRIAE